MRPETQLETVLDKGAHHQPRQPLPAARRLGFHADFGQPAAHRHGVAVAEQFRVPESRKAKTTVQE